MIRQFCALTIFAGVLMLATGALSLPTSNELRQVAEAAGAAAAGFAICDDKSKATQIKNKFRDVADACTSTQSAKASAMNAFDLAYVNTLNTYSQVGGTCKGQNAARFDTVVDALDRAEENC